MRILSNSPASVRRFASVPSSRSHRAGRRGSNIFTTASEASPASFRPARRISRCSISRRYASGLTASSAQRTPTHQRIQAVIRGRSQPATGMSMANSRPPSRVIRRSARRRGSGKPRRRQPSPRYGEQHRIHRRSCLGRRRHLHQSGDHPGLWAEQTPWVSRASPTPKRRRQVSRCRAST